MRFPTPAQLDAWAATLAATDWHGLTHGINVAITREVRGGNSTPDGYPVSTRGGMGGGAELTPVEAAAAARINGTRDEHHELTRHAVRCLDDILYATGMVINLLAKMEARSITEADVLDGWCSNHARAQIFNVTVEGHHLCDFCISYRNATGRLPSTSIMRKRHETGRAPHIRVNPHG